MARYKLGHKRATRAHPQVLLAGESQAGAGQLIGFALAAPVRGHEGVHEVDDARRGLLVDQLGGLLTRGLGSKHLIVSILANSHENGKWEGESNRGGFVYVAGTKKYGLPSPKPQREAAIYSKHDRRPRPAVLPVRFLPMSIFSSPDANADDPRPADQQASPEPLRPNPNDPATQAETGTPQYGNFGRVEDAPPAPNYDAQGTPTAAGKDGSNDNPDEFSELRSADDEAPASERGARLAPAEQNEDPQAVRAAHNKDNDVQRAAWSDDDRRYAGGKPEATWQELNDKEHQDKANDQ